MTDAIRPIVQMEPVGDGNVRLKVETVMPQSHAIAVLAALEEPVPNMDVPDDDQAVLATTIKEAARALNSAIAKAASAGLHVQLDALESTMIGRPRPVPIVQVLVAKAL